MSTGCGRLLHVSVFTPEDPGRIEPFGEPAVSLRQQVVGFVSLALLLPETASVPTTINQHLQLLHKRLITEVYPHPIRKNSMSGNHHYFEGLTANPSRISRSCALRDTRS